MEKSGVSLGAICRLEAGQIDHPHESTVSRLENVLRAHVHGAASAPVHARGRLREEDFYQPFAQWLMREGGECSIAFPVGGHRFGDKWATPDVIGFQWNAGNDTRDRPDVVVAAEVKIDDRDLLAACAQASCYAVFSHRNYLVVPGDSAPDSLSRPTALCRTLGIGLVLFDRTNPAVPVFRNEVVPRFHKLEYTYEMEYVSKLAPELRRALEAMKKAGEP